MTAKKLLTFLAFALVSATVRTQRDGLKKVPVMLARNRTSITVGRARYELVGMDHPALDDPSTLLLRVVRKNEDGRSVRVYTSESGILIITGQFSDEHLTVAEGLFTFCYRNGQVESSGLFHQGVKTG